MTTTSTSHSGSRFCALAFAACLGCGGWQSEDDMTDAGAATGGAAGAGGEAGSVVAPTGLKVVGNEIHDAGGNRIVLRGVNRSGTEYQCVKNAGVFDGLATEESVRAMTTWGINAVRVPLNESCWLGINGAPARYARENYQQAIVYYVELLQSFGLVPILDLHWAAPGDELATDELGRDALRPMPNVDHSIDFWRGVATVFRDDEGVVFEPYNEPFPDLNRDTDAAWQCWRDGCETAQYRTDETYAAAGMQALVDAIRDTGARHLILLGGVQYSNDLSQWLTYKPTDPFDNIAAAWHIYDFNECSDLPCWNDEAGTVAAEFPILATEIGQSDCTGESFLRPLMTFLDEQRSGYLAWSWNVLSSPCEPRMPRGDDGRAWPLITSYETPEPKSGYAQVFRDHVMGAMQ